MVLNLGIGSGLFGLIAIACIIWVIYDVLAVNKKISAGGKILWIVLALLFSIITAIVYYLMYKK